MGKKLLKNSSFNNSLVLSIKSAFPKERRFFLVFSILFLHVLPLFGKLKTTIFAAQ